jgi:uncharacterized protein YceH (UPF0502 family)
MLRGPQTPGELKQRAGRMHAFSGLDPVHETLERLGARQLVARLDRRPGQKEERYAQLLEDRDPHAAERDLAHGPAPDTAPARALGPDADEQGMPGSDGWPASGSDPPAGDAALAGPADVLGTLTSLGERLVRVEQEVAELRAALAAQAAGSQPSSARPQPGPEPASPDRPSQGWP